MAEILISEVTSGDVDGAGVFDALMKAHQERLDIEYTKGRIKGTDYSKVYLGGMEAAMQQAIAFVLGKQQADKQAELLSVQKAQVEAETTNIGKTGDKIDAETSLLGQQEATSLAQASLYGAQEVKITEEKDLITQKILTEEAQTTDLIGDTDAVVAGVVGKQKNLYGAQADGFARDAEQKLLKIFTDSYSVRRTTDEALPPPNALRDQNISTIAQKAAVGIDSTLDLVPDA